MIQPVDDADSLTICVNDVHILVVKGLQKSNKRFHVTEESGSMSAVMLYCIKALSPKPLVRAEWWRQSEFE